MKYTESIIDKNTKRCFFCGASPTAIHHVMNGVGHREKSTKYGLIVGLCPLCHTDSNWSVHRNKERDFILKREAQRQFEKLYSHELWMKEFGKNYL